MNIAIKVVQDTKEKKYFQKCFEIYTQSIENTVS